MFDSIEKPISGESEGQGLDCLACPTEEEELPDGVAKASGGNSGSLNEEVGYRRDDEYGGPAPSSHPSFYLLISLKSLERYLSAEARCIASKLSYGFT